MIDMTFFPVSSINTVQYFYKLNTIYIYDELFSYQLYMVLMELFSSYIPKETFLTKSSNIYCSVFICFIVLILFNVTVQLLIGYLY